MVFQGLCAWYYPGQPEIEIFLHEGSLAALLSGGGGGEGAHEAVAAVIG
jgi:Ca2+:H+ antiporter